MSTAEIDTHERAERYKEASVFKQMDYIPFVSIISGVARAIFGAMEVIVGIFSWPIELFVNVADGSNHQLIIIQGLANFFRGCVAATPFAGNVYLYVYDRVTRN